MKLLLPLALLAANGLTQAATLTQYANNAAWQAALSGAPSLQDFSGFALDQPLSGVSLLPGVSASSNAPTLTATFGGLWAAGNRASGTLYYQIDYTLPYLGFALSLRAFEQDPNDPSKGQGPGTLELLFADGDLQTLFVHGTPAGDPIFLGFTSDSAIQRLRWYEAHELSGGNEESTLDDLQVADRQRGNLVPLPGSLALLSLGAVAAWAQRRRRP